MAGTAAPLPSMQWCAMPDETHRNAASAASDAFSRTLSGALAAPLDDRLPCPQLRMVSSETSMRSANSAWLKPRRVRSSCGVTSRWLA